MVTVCSFAAEYGPRVFGGIEDREQFVRVERLLQWSTEQSVREWVLQGGDDLPFRVSQLAADHEVPERYVASKQ